MDITLQEIAELVDSTRGSNYFANQFESSLKPLFKKLNNVEKDTSKLDISKLLHVDERLMPTFKRRYEKALESFLDGFEKKIKEFNKTGVLRSAIIEDSKNVKSKIKTRKLPVFPPSISNISDNRLPKIPSIPATTPIVKPKSGLDIKNESNVTSVHIESINKDLMSKLGHVAPKAGTDSDKSKDKEKKESSNLGSIGKLIGSTGLGLIALTAGALALYEGFNNDGKLKGLLKVIGRKLVTMGSNLMGRVFSTISDTFGKVSSSKTLAKTALKMPKLANLFSKLGKLSKLAGKGATIAFKGIPWLGSVIGLAFAYSRFKAGDNLGGILEIVSSLLSLAPIPYLSSAVDLFLAYRDITTTKKERGVQLGNITQGIHKWLSKSKLYNAYYNVFSGIAMFLSAKSGGDIDKAVDQLKKGGGMLLEVFPVAQYITSVVDFFKDGGAKKLAKSVGKAYYSYITGKWMRDLLIKGLGSTWDYLKGLFGNIANSDTGKLIGLLIKEKSIQFKLKMVSVIGKVIELINIIPNAINESYEAGLEKFKESPLMKIKDNVILRANPVFGATALLLDMIEKSESPDGGIVKNLDKDKLANDVFQKQLMDDLDKNRAEQFIEFEKRAESKRLDEMKEVANAKKNQERMHKESIELAAATLQAIQEQTGVTAATANSGGGGNTSSQPAPTIIYQGSSETGSKRVRDAAHQLFN